MNATKIKELSALLLATVMVTLTVFFLQDWTVYLASAFVVVCWVLFFFKAIYWKYLLLVGLLLAQFDVVQFSFFHSVFAISGAEISLIPLGMLVLHLVANREIAIDPFRNWQKRERGQDAEHNKNMVDRFVTKFEAKSDAELQKIIDEKELRKEALQAAQTILNRRGM